MFWLYFSPNFTVCSGLSHTASIQFLKLALLPLATGPLHVQSPLIKKLFFPAHLLPPQHWAISFYLCSELESLPSGPFPKGPLSLPPATIRLCRSFCIHRSPFLRWEIHMHSCNYLNNIFALTTWAVTP